MEPIIKKGAFAADDVGMKVVRLKAVDTRGGFTDPTIFELYEANLSRREIVECEVRAFG